MTTVTEARIQMVEFGRVATHNGFRDKVFTAAYELLPKCVEVEQDDGEAGFNLYEFLRRLEEKLETEFADMKFRLDSVTVARFAWRCLCDKEDGDTFRGLPILE